MDFFGQQDSARRRSRGLVGLLLIAVVCVVIAVYLAVSTLATVVGGQVTGGAAGAGMFWRIDIFICVALGTLALILGGSVHKILELREGGHMVAHKLGGRPISPDTTDVEERRLLNVVEEMSIASGVPVPPVFLLDREEGINAFAAGASVEDAVIGVTAGCLEHLTRDELQALVAHQFSHVLNGDMRFNLRMIGILHGILLLGILGYFLLRIAFRTRHRHRRDDDGRMQAILIAFGAALVVIGYVGLFFGRVIKARISRQRKWLADAATVQFTRNPDALATVLRKIDELPEHGYLDSPHAEEASHLYFATGIRVGGLYATHPSISERLGRLDPANATEGLQTKTQPASASDPTGTDSPSGKINPMLMMGGAFINQVGRPAPEHVAYATEALRRIPTELMDAAHCDHGARAIVYLLLLQQHPVSSREEHKVRLSASCSNMSELAEPFTNLSPLVESLPAELRLPLLEVLIPALRNLNEHQFKEFEHQINTLIASDGDIDIFEFCIRRIVLQHLDAHLHGPPDLSEPIEDIGVLAPDANLVLSYLAEAGHYDSSQARQALSAAAEEWQGLSEEPKSSVGLAEADAALDRLRTAAPSIKKTLLSAALRCISFDEKITVEEAEIFRAIAETLGCPVPPVVPCKT